MTPEMQKIRDESITIQMKCGKSVILDKYTFLKFKDKKIYIDKTGYPYFHIIKNGKRKPIRIHKAIMNSSSKLYVDHINGNKLDNRSCNLRFISAAGNSMNSAAKKKKKSKTKYKGIYFCQKRKLWNAQIGINYKRIFLGRFKLEIDAAKKYDKAAIKYFGEYARLNFPNKEVLSKIRGEK